MLLAVILPQGQNLLLWDGLNSNHRLLVEGEKEHIAPERLVGGNVIPNKHLVTSVIIGDGWYLS